MIDLDKLNSTLTDIMLYDKNLNLTQIDTHMPNGLQVKGSDKIEKVGFGVSASLELFRLAVEKGCQALVVHHAINLPPSHCYDALFQNRMSFLTDNKISLFGYHFLLDSHPRIGHNTEIIKAIGGTPTKPYFSQGTPWGFEGKIDGTTLKELVKTIQFRLSPKTMVYEFGPKIIKKVVAVSGSGAPYSGEMQYMIDNEIDLYITGENSEWIREIFRESKINFIAGGHYHTEKFGLLALEKTLKDKLKVETEFIELENEI